jgi:hypothetical protein
MAVKALNYGPYISGINPYWLFLWGYVADCVYIPLLPTEVNDFKHSICEANASTEQETLKSSWL